MPIRPDPESVTPKSNYVHACGLPVKLADLTEYFFSSCTERDISDWLSEVADPLDVLISLDR